ALVVQQPGGDTEIIDLLREPIGELTFGPGGTLYQNTRTPNSETPGGYEYAMTVITPASIQPAPAAARFALIASNTLDTGTNTVPLPGQPVGAMAIGSDGTAYQTIRAPGENSQDPSCLNCSVAIVLPGSTSASTVDLPGYLHGVPPNGASYVTAGPNRTAYLTTTDNAAQTTTVWRINANTAEATPITLTGTA